MASEHNHTGGKGADRTAGAAGKGKAGHSGADVAGTIASRPTASKRRASAIPEGADADARRDSVAAFLEGVKSSRPAAKDARAQATLDGRPVRADEIEAALEGEAFKVKRVTTGPALRIIIDGPDGGVGHGFEPTPAKDPAVDDPQDPRFMDDGEREAYPDGVLWRATLDRRTVAALLEDPNVAKHFEITPAR